MRAVKVNLDERILAESQEYARRTGTTLDALVQELLTKAVRQESGSAFLKMVAEAKALGLRSESGPLSRAEANLRG